MNRRELLQSAKGLVGALVALAALPPLAYLFGSARKRTKAASPWADMGSASKIEDETWQRKTLLIDRTNLWRRDIQEEVVYARRKGDAIEAVSAICPHTGCLVKLEAKGFVCPCHRSLFDAEGKAVEGPSPRPLDRLECKTERGRALVRYRRFRPGVATPEPLDA